MREERELSFWRRSRRLDRMIARYVVVLASVLGIVVSTFGWLTTLDKETQNADANRYEAQRLLHALADESAALTEFALTGARAYLEPYETARRDLSDRLGLLRDRTRNDPPVARELDAFAAGHDLWERDMAEPVLGEEGNERENHLRADSSRVRAGSGLMQSMHANVAAIDAYYVQTLDRIERQRGWLRYVSYALILLAILLVATYGYYSEGASAHREERLLRSVLSQRDTLARQSEWRTKIIAILAHDFRTSLAVIQVNAELLEAHPEVNQRSAAFRAIYKGVSDLAAMTDEALLMARVANDTLIIVPHPVFVYDVVAEVADRFLNRQDIRVTLSDEYVLGDGSYLARVFDNLISNAVKYSNGPVDVRITSHEHTVEICVIDRGPGIDAADLPHVFEEYWRAESAKGKRGSGIGLYIVKKIVDAHHGTVNIDSTPGEGTRVCIFLPRAGAPATQFAG